MMHRLFFLSFQILSLRILLKRILIKECVYCSLYESIFFKVIIWYLLISNHPPNKFLDSSDSIKKQLKFVQLLKPYLSEENWRMVNTTFHWFYTVYIYCNFLYWIQTPPYYMNISSVKVGSSVAIVCDAQWPP